MAWPLGTHIERVITHARSVLDNVRIVRHDVSQTRAIIDLDGAWKQYRIIISEIHRAERTVRYAYYVLDRQNRVVAAFDNSPDHLAIKQRYGIHWKAHLRDEIPHQHDSEGNLTLTSAPMTCDAFLEWLRGHFPNDM